MKTRRFCSLSRTWFLVAAIVAAACHCSVFAADSSKKIRADFELLQKSFADLKHNGTAVNEKITKFAAYLDQLVSAPSSVTGKGIDSIATSVSDLSEDQFDSLMEGNMNELSVLIAEDDSVRQSLSEMDTEVASISAFLEKTAGEVADLQTQATDLVARIADYAESRTFGAIGLVPLTMKIKGTATDIGEVAKVIPNTMAQTGVVVSKMGKVNALTGGKESGVEAKPDVDVSVAETDGPAVQTDTGASAPTSPEVSQIDMFNGQWKEADATAQPAILFLGNPVLGQPSGMMAAGARGIQASLVLKEHSNEQFIYSDPSSGNLFRISSFDDQIILKHYKPDGTKIFQIFMERPQEKNRNLE